MSVRATRQETARLLPGDDILVSPDVVMDRAFSLPAPPTAVWPWFVQLGKGRAGWYLSRRVERFEPARRRGLRTLDPRHLGLADGDVIADWGGQHATFEVVSIQAPHALVYKSTRGRTQLSWAIVLAEEDGGEDSGTRVQLRLRLGPVKHRRLAATLGGFFDWATVAGLAAGLRERVLDGRAQRPYRPWSPSSR